MTKASELAIRRDVLPNGLTVVSERMEHVRSVSAGIWVRSGSRREPAKLNGVTHFIEHMMFKGTERRSAEEIAQSMDAVGGMLDAFTAKEMTSFSAKVLDEHLPVAFEVLADMVLRSRFAAADIEKEKAVVIEEIKMDLDNPDYVVHEVFTQGFWRGHPLGQPIIGTPATVRRFHRQAVTDCYRQWYVPSNIVITAAGNVQHERLLELVQREFGGLRSANGAAAETAPQAEAHLTTRNKKDLEQMHVCLGVRAYPVAHEKRFALAALNSLLGGSMSSRLFQNIRERQGLVYSVFSDLNLYRDAGALTVYAGMARDKVERVIRSVMEEFHRLKEELVPPAELRRVKDHLKGSLPLSLESTSSRMGHLARQELYFGRFYSVEELMASIEAVTAEEVQQIAREMFRPEQIAGTVLGPLDGFRLKRSLLE